MKQHENYKELIWMLAKTDFKLRYQSSVLGYLWALLKPLFLFAILYFVFSSIFNPRTLGSQYYSLQLLTGLVLFNFFSEGTSAGMSSLLSKAQLVTKIYIPRWTIILSSTINATLIFLMNLLIIILFFSIKKFMPSFEAIVLFVFFSIATYLVILAFALITAPLYVKFRDLMIIWEVVLAGLFYATPVFYPLQMLPIWVQKILLINPIAFIVHFSKEGLINNHFADLWKTLIFITAVVIFLLVSILSYRHFSQRIAEEI